MMYIFIHKYVNIKELNKNYTNIHYIKELNKNCELQNFLCKRPFLFLFICTLIDHPYSTIKKMTIIADKLLPD
jgi:hypothetical protein